MLPEQPAMLPRQVNLYGMPEPLQLGGYELIMEPPHVLEALTLTVSLYVHLICKSGDSVVAMELADGSMLNDIEPGD
jgi:hypothetical protein